MKKIAFGSLWSAVLFYGLFVYWIGFFSNPASPVQAGYIITPTGTRILTPTKTPTSTATCNPTGTILGSHCGPTDLIANDQSIIHLEALTNTLYASFSGGVSIFPGYQIETDGR